ncbi:MAG: adenylyltransferase/cytidyltransferase family protein [Candidatus Omnitrophica bacterium]|jgi:D-beta-D-heptose 7-phosphate kinase/D-beta-D-heptose 1-phosphate adenosyltransferase|nr:adenylyltransferase/cytidyltransferase family protein [Candidatus Omnitrophota bacterium]
MSKIKSLSDLKKVVYKLKKEGKKIVFTNGCFDILHPGHIKILTIAKNKGDILIVGLNSDSSVHKIKGLKRPILKEKARAKILEHIDVVDYITIFSEKTPYEVIKNLKPDCLVKGEDWAKDKIIGKEFVTKVYRVKMFPGYSTTNIIDYIKNA